MLFVKIEVMIFSQRFLTSSILYYYYTLLLFFCQDFHLQRFYCRFCFFTLLLYQKIKWKSIWKRFRQDDYENALDRTSYENAFLRKEVEWKRFHKVLCYENTFILLLTKV